MTRSLHDFFQWKKWLGFVHSLRSESCWICYVPGEMQKSVGLSAARLLVTLHWHWLCWYLYPLRWGLLRFLFGSWLRGNQYYYSYLSSECNLGSYCVKKQFQKTWKACLAVWWQYSALPRTRPDSFRRTSLKGFTKSQLSHYMHYSSNIWKCKKKVEMCLEPNKVNKVCSSVLDFFFP